MRDYTATFIGGGAFCTHTALIQYYQVHPSLLNVTATGVDLQVCISKYYHHTVQRHTTSIHTPWPRNTRWYVQHMIILLIYYKNVAHTSGELYPRSGVQALCNTSASLFIWKVRMVSHVALLQHVAHAKCIKVSLGNSETQQTQLFIGFW